MLTALVWIFLIGGGVYLTALILWVRLVSEPRARSRAASRPMKYAVPADIDRLTKKLTNLSLRLPKGCELRSALYELVARSRTLSRTDIGHQAMGQSAADLNYVSHEVARSLAKHCPTGVEQANRQFADQTAEVVAMTTKLPACELPQDVTSLMARIEALQSQLDNQELSADIAKALLSTRSYLRQAMVDTSVARIFAGHLMHVELVLKHYLVVQDLTVGSDGSDDLNIVRTAIRQYMWFAIDAADSVAMNARREMVGNADFLKSLPTINDEPHD